MDANDENESATGFQVTGGRDFHLLKLIAKKMNFNVKYLDPSERTQGSSIIEPDTDNLTFSGGLGQIQKRVIEQFTHRVTHKRCVRVSFLPTVSLFECNFMASFAFVIGHFLFQFFTDFERPFIMHAMTFFFLLGSRSSAR